MKKRISKKSLLIALVIIIFGGSIFCSYYFYNKYQTLKKNPNIISEQESKAIVDKVSKLMELPSNEDPTVATVSDKDKLASEQFFKDAQNGDKVLAYVNAKKAILYRPSTNKIIEVAPIYFDQTAQNSNSSTTTTKTLKVAIYDAGAGSTAIQSTQTKIENKISSTQFDNSQTAKKSNYNSNIVIDLSGTNSENAKTIATAIGGKVQTSIPDGETKPNADILVILVK